MLYWFVSSIAKVIARVMRSDEENEEEAGLAEEVEGARKGGVMLYETSHDTMSHLWNLLNMGAGMWHPQGQKGLSPCPFCFDHP